MDCILSLALGFIIHRCTFSWLNSAFHASCYEISRKARYRKRWKDLVGGRPTFDCLDCNRSVDAIAYDPLGYGLVHLAEVTVPNDLLELEPVPRELPFGDEGPSHLVRGYPRS